MALMLGAMVVFASQDGISKHLSVDYAAPQILCVRYAFFVLFACWFARPRGLRNALRSVCPGWQVLRSLLLVLEIGLFIMAVRLLPLADVHALLALAPLLVTALSVPLLGEKVGIRRWLAVAVGFVGMLIILRPGLTVFEPASLIALAAAAVYALYIVLTRKVGLRDDARTTLMYTAVVGAVAMSLLGPFYWRPPDAGAWAFLLLLSITGSTGHFLFIKALEAAPASVLQPYGYSVLVFATIIGFVVFDDLPDGPTFAGAGVVVASGLYAFYRERRRPGSD